MTDSDEFRKALNSAYQIQITFLGRKTGKKFSIPIWFVSTQENLYLLPVGGTRSKWYKNVMKNPMIEIQAQGKQVSREAHPTQDKKMIGDIMDRFRSKYGASDVKRYYPGQDAAVELPI